MSKRAPTDMDRHVSKRVRFRRLQLGMKQPELAKQIGVAYQQLNRYELGGSRISAGRLHRIAEALRVPVGYFFDKTPVFTQKAKRELEAA